MALNEIDIEGINANDVYTNIIQAGVSKSQAAEFIGSWLLGNAGKTRRTFNYQTAFPGIEADCVSHFHRSFVHRDWQDGEDLVQAEQSAGEDGFNVRFHRIENDLDALGADVAEAFLCLAEMRSSLRALLDELRTELNTIEGDLAALKGGSDGTGIVGTKFGGAYVGTTNFLGNFVDVFRDPSGQMIMTPGIKITGGTGGPVTDPEGRLGRAQSFASFAATNEAFQGLFKNNKAVTKEQVVKAVGNQLIDGIAVKDLIDILPSTARYQTPDSFAAGLAEREGLALRTSGSGEVVVASALGFQGTAGAVQDASIHDFQAVPAAARTALAAAGVGSVGSLAKMSPHALSATLKTAGLTGITPGDTAAWVGAAQTILAVR